MAKASHVFITSRGENISHFASVRFRIIGNGDLQIRAYGLADAVIQQLVSLPMTPATNIEPTRLMNVSQQRLSFEIKVTEFNEWFEISRLIVFHKPLYTQGPNR